MDVITPDEAETANAATLVDTYSQIYSSGDKGLYMMIEYNPKNGDYQLRDIPYNVAEIIVRRAAVEPQFKAELLAEILKGNNPLWAVIAGQLTVTEV